MPSKAHEIPDPRLLYIYTAYLGFLIAESLWRETQPDGRTGQLKGMRSSLRFRGARPRLSGAYLCRVGVTGYARNVSKKLGRGQAHSLSGLSLLY